jgi:hypothetical protein
MKRNIAKTLAYILIPLMIFVAGCAVKTPPTAEETTPPLVPTAAQTTAIIEPTPTQTAFPAADETSPPTETLAPTNTPDLRLNPESWQIWPIIPELSPEMKAVYLKGLEMGRDPRVFSVIGDCQSSPTYFLSLYDEDRYTLPDDQVYLKETIDWYAGSFSHRSITVKNGMTAPGALNPLWAEPELCESQETPVECEIRLSNPSLVLISLGTNWHPSTSQEQYIDYLSQIVETLMENGVIPVLSTKADNVEGDYSRNLAMAQVAYNYRLPMWNFWAAVKDLPNMGLDDTREDLYLKHDGWDVRNFSALEVLDHIHRQLLEIEE